MLTKEKQERVRKLALGYYNTICKNSFNNSNRFCGMELEFSIIDKKNILKPGLAKKISDSTSNYHIVPELGSYQIEINPPPLKIESKVFHNLYKIFQNSRIRLQEISSNYNANVIPIGLPFYLGKKFFKNDGIYTDKKRYVTSAEYFGGMNKKGTEIMFKDGTKLILPGASGVSVINELHIQLQAINIHDLVRLFNYSQMITAPFVAIGANSGITNGKELVDLDHQIKIFERTEGILDGFPGFPRTGLFPGYIKSMDEFFDVALSFKPIHYPLDGRGYTAFDLMLGTYFAWTRIRHGIIPKPHMRIEFRPLSSQPTIIENVALSEFYIKTILYLVENNLPLIPERFLMKNFRSCMKDGMNAIIYWTFNGEVKKVPVGEILRLFIDSITDGELLHLLYNRVDMKCCPAQKLISETKEFGYKKAISRYKNSFENEENYV